MTFEFRQIDYSILRDRECKWALDDSLTLLNWKAFIQEPTLQSGIPTKWQMDWPKVFPGKRIL